MDLLDTKLKITHLKQEIRKHDELYFIKSSPIITDHQYDILRKEVERLEFIYPELRSDTSVTQTVGVKSHKSFLKVRHKYPMLSLKNAFSVEDVVKFFTRINKFAYLGNRDKVLIQCEPKIDGVSFAAYFNNGKLKSAATRGDGIVGEDITTNIKTIATFPARVDYLKNFEVRGEVYITKKDFLELNKYITINNKPPFANPRNAASGSLRQLNSNITKRRRLNYFIWGGEISHIDTQKEMMEKFSSLGFITNDNTLLSDNIEDIIDYHKTMNMGRSDLDYDIDGLVYKVNNLKLQRYIGNISRAPKWAIAHKFPAEHAETMIEDIRLQVSRTGAITPVAKLRPINIGGTLVTKALLHNEKEILKKDIKIGDIVLIKKAGDVIPQVVEVILKKRTSTVKSFCFPDKCPACHSQIINCGSDVVKRCTGGTKCDAQLIERLCHFVSKNAFNIEGLSKYLIVQLYKKKLLRLPADLFRLQDFIAPTQITKWERWGDKSVNNLFSSIKKSKIIPLDRFIYALGIRYVGNVTAKTISTHFKDINSFLNFISQDNQRKKLKEVKGIGRITMKNFIDFFSHADNINNTKNILKYITVTPILELKTVDNKLKDKTIVFTGTLKKYSRDIIHNIAKTMGATIATSVSHKVDYVVYGKNAGTKLHKANLLNIETISEDKFLYLINDSNRQSKI